jgi:CHAD domain-containing protein
MEEQQTGIMLDVDSEFLHDYRVALRRSDLS